MTLIEQKNNNEIKIREKNAHPQDYNCAMSFNVPVPFYTYLFKAAPSAIESLSDTHNRTARLIIQLYVKIILIVIIKRSIPIVSHLQLMASWLCVVFIASSFG